jgi:hypothetical protein
MAAKAKPKSKNKARSAGGKKNPGTKVVFISPKQNKGGVTHRKKSRNPTFFGSNATPIQMGQYVLGGLIGVTVNRVVLPMLPAALTSSNTFATLSAFGLAALEWWAASFISKDFGAAVGFGALMNAATQGLNAFVPSVGTTIGLSGRGTGEFVPAKFAVPQNPISDAGVAGVGASMRSAYPAAYALAA